MCGNVAYIFSKCYLLLNDKKECIDYKFIVGYITNNVQGIFGRCYLILDKKKEDKCIFLFHCPIFYLIMSIVVWRIFLL